MRKSRLAFCCAGCLAVHELIHGFGLGDYYDLRPDGGQEPARASDRMYDEYDAPSFRERYVRKAETSAEQCQLYLEGIHCAACVWLLEHTPGRVRGLRRVRIELGRSRATVTWDPAVVSLSHIARQLDRLGYPSHPYRGRDVEERQRQEDRDLLIRIGVSGAVAGNVMLAAFALYGGYFHGMAPRYEELFRWASLIISMPALYWGGGYFFRGAWTALRCRRLHMDVPISLGILGAFLGGAVHTVRGSGEIYFESVTVLIFLLLVGRFLQQRQQRRAGLAAELLQNLAPHSARIEQGERTVDVPVEALQPGDVLRMAPGDVLPTDGVVLEGHSAIDRSWLTGESRPIDVEPGCELFGGSANLSGPLRVSVTTHQDDSRLARLVERVREHERKPDSWLTMADRLSGVFTGTVLALAALTAVLWWMIDPQRVTDHVIALLVVTCPCALGLATPLALSSAIGQAARRGILIRGASSLERLARPGRIWLDKTGTITSGKLVLREWWGARKVRVAVAALERDSRHPVAIALREGVEGPLPTCSDVRETPGLGIEGRVTGHWFRVGRASDLVEAGSDAACEYERLAATGDTVVGVTKDGRLVALAALGDGVRPDARQAIGALTGMGWQVGILSGDAPAAVESAASEVGVPPEKCRPACSPEDKLAVVSGRNSEACAMVGDGINDAPALAAAPVGIAVRGGAEAALAAADVYLMRGGLEPLLSLIRGARRTARVIRWNLLFSLAYNVTGASLAIAGLIHPVLAAILMPVSSLTVTTTSFRARMFREEGVHRSAEGVTVRAATAEARRPVLGG